jgi:hypothetical protein
MLHRGHSHLTSAGVHRDVWVEHRSFLFRFGTETALFPMQLHRAWPPPENAFHRPGLVFALRRVQGWTKYLSDTHSFSFSCGYPQWDFRVGCDGQ